MVINGTEWAAEMLSRMQGCVKLQSQSAQPALWRSASQAPRFGSGEIHVWRANLNEHLGSVDYFLRVLSPSEQAKAQRYYFRRDCERFVITRGILRLLLGQYIGVEPAHLLIDYGPYGKPVLSTTYEAERLHFNVSHSRSLALYAVARDCEVGIDVEYVRDDLAFVDIARQLFSSGEIEKLRKLPQHQRAKAFFKVWTHKEALVKAVGKGLSMPLNQFEVSSAPEDQAGVLAWSLPGWSLQELSPGTGYVAAIAFEGAVSTLSQWQWSKVEFGCAT